jgi:hypothetical protein
MAYEESDRTRWMRLSRGRLNYFTHHLRLHHARMARGTSNSLSGHVTDRIMFYLHHFEKELPEVRIRFGGSGGACAHLALRDMTPILRRTKRLAKTYHSEDIFNRHVILQFFVLKFTSRQRHGRLTWSSC